MTVRYPLHAGLPAAKPDLVYPESLLPAFHVAENGDLYAIASKGNGCAVDVFAPNATRPERVLDLFAGFSLQWVGLTEREEGVHGQAQPASCFYALYQLQSFYDDIGVDSAGSLYFPQGDHVSVFGTPASNPTLLRTLSGASFKYASDIARDDDGEAYVLNGTAYSYVAVYAPNANGTVVPERTLENPTKQQWSGNVAVAGPYLYVAREARACSCTTRLRTAAPHRRPP